MSKQRVLSCLGFLVLFLLLAVILSLCIGSKSMSMQALLTALGDLQGDSFEAAIIMERIPRTIFGMLAGAGLAVSGCMLQAVTRNPIADPGILGVNTGASLAVVIGIAFFSISSQSQYIWLAFLGAMITALFVYGMASHGSNGPTPVSLVLAGAAVSIALASVMSMVMLPNAFVMDRFRFWQTGSIGGADWTAILTMLPYLFVGFLLSFSMAASLNALALGDELASGLGVGVKRIRILSAFAGVLLCACVTALAGPIGFLGLMVPHFIRSLISSDMRILLPFSAIGGGAMLLLCDVIGRVVLSPSELEVGIVTAILGAPVFILMIRKAKVKEL